MACYRCMFSSIIWQVLLTLPVEQEHTIHPMASMCAHSALQFLGNGAHPLTLLGLPADPEPAALWPPASWAVSWFFFLLKSAKSWVYVFCYRKDWTSTLQYGTQKLCMYGNGEDDLGYWTCVQSQLLYVAIKICSNQIKSNQIKSLTFWTGTYGAAHAVQSEAVGVTLGREGRTPIVVSGSGYTGPGVCRVRRGGRWGGS